MNPPSTTAGEVLDAPNTAVHFITAQSNLRHAPCTRDVFRRVEGKPRPKQPHPGMDMRRDLEFLVGINEDGIVTSVDTFPKLRKLMHNVARADEQNPDLIQLTVGAEGQIDIKTAPGHVLTKGFIRVIQLLDTVAEIKPGMRLDGRHEVMSVAGNRVEIDFAGGDTQSD